VRLDGSGGSRVGEDQGKSPEIVRSTFFAWRSDGIGERFL
jgi:hypothetical protein